MTLDELKLQIEQICVETTRSVLHAESLERSWDIKREGSERLRALFEEYRDDVFRLSKRLPDHWQPERDLKEQEPATWHFLRDNALAFFTCSCGSRQDSCAEDGEGNFSTFIFTQEGSVFRRVEKKQ